MTYVVTESCIKCKYTDCVDVCPVDCIHSNDDSEQYYINPDQCIDCAACELACPVSAIFDENSLDGEQRRFIEINANFFR